MKPMGDARAHYWRTLKMARATGLPLAQALLDGTLSQTDYADIITRCRRCPAPEKCERMLAQSAAIPAPPSYCTNRETFAALKLGGHDKP